jgi:hypothetical protein
MAAPVYLLTDVLEGRAKRGTYLRKFDLDSNLTVYSFLNEMVNKTLLLSYYFCNKLQQTVF